MGAFSGFGFDLAGDVRHRKRLDTDFLSETHKLKMDIEPIDCASLDRTAQDIIASQAPAVALATQIIGKN